MKFLCMLICLILFIFIIINIPYSDKNTTAIFGLIGVIAGSSISIIGNIILHNYKEKPNKEFQKLRMDILKKLLNDERYKWRELSTLSSVIGATENETRRLLIKINARASETKKKDKDGNDIEIWGYLKNHPLENIRC